MPFSLISHKIRQILLVLFFKLIYFYLEDNFFAILYCSLLYIDMSQSSVDVCPSLWNLPSVSHPIPLL